MIVTESDRERLQSLLKNHNGPLAPGIARGVLRQTLESATVVPSSEVPPTAVTMNSIVGVIDLASGRIASYSLVYPSDADVDRCRISILTPLGAALLGRSEREVVEVSTPAGVRRYYIQEILYQPEAVVHTSGHSSAA
jgi:regulator of nucleoside diphosphate kinase